jgi:cyclohexanone monooxygenase
MSESAAVDGAGGAGHWKVAIVGAGPGGLGLAIRLAQTGQRDFVLFEATDGVGGTWRVNTYPGAACDVPSHLYSYSFALKPDWSKTYANQPEILEYFEECAERYGILPHLRPRTRITAARWDDEACRWGLTDADGHTYSCDVLVSAIGTFGTPSYPSIDGLDDFAGPSFHSARWEHEHDLADKRVAVIGTGASAAQIIPEVAKIAEQVDVYQRTPQWILPRSDKPFSEEDKQRFARSTRAAKKHRDEIYWAFDNCLPVRGRRRRRAAGLGSEPHRPPDQGRRAEGKTHPGLPLRLQADTDLQ